MLEVKRKAHSGGGPDVVRRGAGVQGGPSVGRHTAGGRGAALQRGLVPAHLARGARLPAPVSATGGSRSVWGTPGPPGGAVAPCFDFSPGHKASVGVSRRPHASFSGPVDPGPWLAGAFPLRPGAGRGLRGRGVGGAVTRNTGRFQGTTRRVLSVVLRAGSGVAVAVPLRWKDRT